VEAALAELKTASAGEDAARITAKADDLGKAAMKLGEALYRQAGDAAFLCVVWLRSSMRTIYTAKA
jgi:molecular chaperone DnaK